MIVILDLLKLMAVQAQLSLWRNVADLTGQTCTTKHMSSKRVEPQGSYEVQNSLAITC